RRGDHPPRRSSGHLPLRAALHLRQRRGPEVVYPPRVHRAAQARAVLGAGGAAARAHPVGAEGRSPEADAGDAGPPLAGVRALPRSGRRGGGAAGAGRGPGARSRRHHQRRLSPPAVGGERSRRDRARGAGDGPQAGDDRRRAPPLRNHDHPARRAAPQRAPARAVDPGLLVLPTHRLVKGLPAQALASLPERVRPWFTVTEGDETGAHAIEHRLAREGTSRVTFALRQPGQARSLWLGLRPDADLGALGPPALQGLDVTVLHGLLLGPLLGIDAAAMAKQSFLSYTHDMDEALARIEAGEVQGGFLMNATKVEQVLDACEAGFVLPQKSTYFQPKLATGLVMARIDPHAHPHLPE